LIVLQLMTAPTQQGQAGTDAVLPAAGQADAEALDFALLGEALAVAPEMSEALPVEPLPEVAAEQPAAQPDQAPLQSAEQWLLSVLDQRQVKVEAREGEPQLPEVEGEVVADVALALPADLLVRQPQARVEQSTADIDAQRAALQQAPRGEAMAALLALGQNGPHNGVAEAAGSATPISAEALAALDGTAPVNLAGNPTDNQALRAPASPQPTVAAEATPTLERQLKLQTPQEKWGEQMLGALRDSVELQLRQQVQSATIRLDPPELGSLEILLSHESGRLNVQISAAQGDVARLLQQTSERLRQELVGQNFLQVNVQVGSDAQSGQHGQQHQRWRASKDEAVAQALRLEPDAEGARQGAGDDVLITV
jgi:flagellar hook-length control protein FliK